jgi:hypothetical protein
MNNITLTDKEVKALVDALSFSLRDKLSIVSEAELIRGDLKFRLKGLLNE